MLVLTRRLGESINIGDDIVVTVVAVSGGQVRLGIAAPRHIHVLRGEIYQALQKENRAAARGLQDPQQLADVVARLQEKKPGQDS